MIMRLGWCFWYSIIIGIAVGMGTWKVTFNVDASFLFGGAVASFSLIILEDLKKTISLLKKISFSDERIKGGEEE